MIIGQWMATRPGKTEDEMFPALRDAARHYGVVKPRLELVHATPDMAAMHGVPYPADFWTWQGEVNLLALPVHVIGSGSPVR